MSKDDIIQFEEDPTYNHFSHRDDFLQLLSNFLKLDISGTPTELEQRSENALADKLGLIVDLALLFLMIVGLLPPFSWTTRSYAR
jgi:hypothetical protein